MILWFSVVSNVSIRSQIMNFMHVLFAARHILIDCSSQNSIKQIGSITSECIQKHKMHAHHDHEIVNSTSIIVHILDNAPFCYVTFVYLYVCVSSLLESFDA